MRHLFAILSVMIVSVANGQQFSETITKNLKFEKAGTGNALVIANLNGRVVVEGYDGNEILVEVEKIVIGKTEERLAQGKTEVQLGVIDDADTIVLYVTDGCNTFSRNNGDGSGNWSEHGWSYNSNREDRRCNNRYDYRMNFKVRVPASINILASTINNGDISVDKVNGVVKASNINGSIDLSNLVREAQATTINGDVDITFLKNPSNDCRFYSLNGDINAFFPKGLGAELSFESFNGDFYTNIGNIQALPVKVVKNEHKKGTHYKVNGNRYQVGNGGAFLDFETFNGNVYLKEN